LHRHHRLIQEFLLLLVTRIDAITRKIHPHMARSDDVAAALSALESAVTALAARVGTPGLDAAQTDAALARIAAVTASLAGIAPAP